MSSVIVVKELPASSKWHGAVSDEDAELIRRRHAEKVEKWLDFADFATELFKLHEKYGIDKGEEGYFAYRKHLRTNYNERLATYGPTPDPLDEGCDCIFCGLHSQETPAEPVESLNETPIEPEPNRKQESAPAEPRCDIEQSEKKPRPVPTNGGDLVDEETSSDESVSRYDSVGGVCLDPPFDWGASENPPVRIIIPFERPAPQWRNDQSQRSKKWRDGPDVRLRRRPLPRWPNSVLNRGPPLQLVE